MFAPCGCSFWNGINVVDKVLLYHLPVENWVRVCEWHNLTTKPLQAEANYGKKLHVINLYVHKLLTSTMHFCLLYGPRRLVLNSAQKVEFSMGGKTTG